MLLPNCYDKGILLLIPLCKMLPFIKICHRELVLIRGQTKKNYSVVCSSTTCIGKRNREGQNFCGKRVSLVKIMDTSP